MSLVGPGGRPASPRAVRRRRHAFGLLFALSVVGGPLMAQQPRPAVPAADDLDSPDLRIARARLRIFDKLDSPADISVRRMPLSDFARLLSKRHGIPFQLDKGGLRRAEVRSNDPVSLEVKNVPLEIGLRRALKPLNLTCFATAEGVVITDWNWIDHYGTRSGTLRAAQSQLPVEIAFVKRVAAPSADQIRAIKKDLPKRIGDAYDRLESLTCDEFLDALTDCVAHHLSKDQVARYLTELAKRRRQEREACIDMFVALLDAQMRLREEQRKLLVATLTPHWNPGWTQTFEVALETGGGEIPGLPDNLILPILDPDQVKIWRRFSRNWADRPEFKPERIGSLGTPLEQPEHE